MAFICNYNGDNNVPFPGEIYVYADIDETHFTIEI